MPDPVAESHSWLDWSRALAIVDDDAALLAHLVDVFIGQYGAVVAELRDAVRDGGWPAVARRTHQLAGAAGALGALALERKAREALAAAGRLGATTPEDAQPLDIATVVELIRHLEWTLGEASAWRQAAR